MASVFVGDAGCLVCLGRCVLGRFSGMPNQFESMGASVLYDFGESPMTKGMVTNQGSANNGDG